ncbi:MAG: cobyrinate a,c-diamide synthase [Desulfobacteraceae bacterium]|nr:cobyrinate a,c-diamide synthase [Desulfobacteraceae bacterium]
MKHPGIVISALRGGSGKTILTVGIIAALRKLGNRVAPFKKGPDYIDAGWLSLAAGRPCYNLDSFLIDSRTLLSLFHQHTVNTDLAVIEGNRGLYDCIDIKGETSTAELAKLLKLPVLLCIDGTKTTRTMAAVVSGCRQFDAQVTLSGVILNRVAGPRHEKILRDSIEHHCGVPVVGSLPKLGGHTFPERHMGLVPTPEHEWADPAIRQMAEIAAKYVDLEKIRTIARRDAGTLQVRKDAPENLDPTQRPVVPTSGRPKIGVVRDSAFQFYYPENIEALSDNGAELVFISPLAQRDFPDLDALYIGGGFPETHAAELAENTQFRNRIKSLADAGLPIYAECGGLMYLGESLVLEGKTYPMCGIFPVVLGLSKKPRGHGYTLIRVIRDTPFYRTGDHIKGHEFHYSYVLEWTGEPPGLAFDMLRGTGCDRKKDGLTYKNVLATYTHIHALGTPAWAHAMVRNAVNYQATKNNPASRP